MTNTLWFPVSLLAALSWARGAIGDAELMLLPTPKTPQAVYWMNLDSLRNFRRVFPSVAAQFHVGASCLILRTGTPAVIHHAEKWGMVRTVQDPSGRWRFIAIGPLVGRYFSRSKKSAEGSLSAERQRVRPRRLT